jgi:hypothetical protein
MNDWIQKEMKDFTDEELKSFMREGINLYSIKKTFPNKEPTKPYWSALMNLHSYLGVEDLTKEEEIKFNELYKEIKC